MRINGRNQAIGSDDEGWENFSPHASCSYAIGVDASAIEQTQCGEQSLRAEDMLDLRHESLGDAKQAADRLVAWFADARTADDGVDGSLPAPVPNVSFRSGHIVSISESGITEKTAGWVEVETGKPFPPQRLKDAVVAGFLAERRFVVEERGKGRRRLKREAASLHALDPAKPERLAEAARLEVAQREDERFVGFSDYFRSEMQAATSENFLLKRVLGLIEDGAAPWRRYAADEGFITDVEAISYTRTGWSWAWTPPGELDLPGNGGDESVTVTEGLVCRLLDIDGEDVAARLARLAVRLERASPRTKAECKVDHGAAALRPIVVPGAAGILAGRTRVLDHAEWRRVFDTSLNVHGSAGEPGFSLPVGTVLVLVDGEPAYIRGRGWRLTTDRRLVAWDWRGEPDFAAECPGIDAVAGRRRDGTFNAAEVVEHGAAHYRGMRWNNVLGNGQLFDETAFEWEDRRDRLRQEVWSRLRAGPAEGRRSVFSASEWRWIIWTLIGHYMLPDDWRLGSGGWRWKSGDGPVQDVSVADEIRYSASPRTELSEWRDVINHDRKWVGDFLGPTLRGHAMLRRIEQRAGGDTSDFLECWLQSVRECVAEMDADAGPSGVSERRQAFQAVVEAAVGPKGFAAFWEDVRHQQAFLAGQDEEFAAAVAEHRAWMRRYARLAYIPDPDGTGPMDGPDMPIVVAPWDEGFAPEPFVVPACMRVPEAEPGEAFDFGSLENQGNGTRARPAPFLSPEYAMARTLPGVHARIAANVNRADEPLTSSPRGPLPGSSLPSDPPERIAADAALLGLNDREMRARFSRIFGEAEALLFRVGSGRSKN